MKVSHKSSSSKTGPIRNRWAFLVGINDYADKAFSTLKFCVNDVLELEQLLKNLGYTVVSLHDNVIHERLKPTRDNVEAELTQLCRVVAPDDLLLVHFACHGMLVNEKPVFITHETRKSILEQKALPLSEVELKIRESKARRVILTIDACHSGVEIGREPGNSEFIWNTYELAEGFALIAASTAQQIAQEWQEKQHGVFTYYLLEGLSSRKADRINKGFVTVDDLKTYVLDGLRRWNVEHGGFLQEPTARTEGMGDIIIADYRETPIKIENNLQFLPHNPFTDTLAVHEEIRFIGRKLELNRLLSRLYSSSVALLGDVKIGKSSLLLNLKRMWKGNTIGPLNCNLLKDQNDFFQHIANELGLNCIDWPEIRNAIEKKKLLFLLDEFDVAPQCGFTYEVLGRFRAICDTNRSFKMVTVTRKPLNEVFPDTGVGSPAYNFLIPFTLGPLNEHDANLLLSHPWAPEAPQFDTETCKNLLHLAEYHTTGYHPFKLQRAAFHRYEALADSTYNWKNAYKQDVEQLL